MSVPARPHLLGVDDGPFDKHTSEVVPLVGVMMEGADLVEGVALTRFPVDGEGVTDFLANWIGGLRFRPGLQAVLLGGITIAGLAVVDVRRLAERLELPVLVVNRRAPRSGPLLEALSRAGLGDRQPLVEGAPPSHRVDAQLHVAAAGIPVEDAIAVVRAARNKSGLPEPIRIAHLVATALERGESRGRP